MSTDRSITTDEIKKLYAAHFGEELAEFEAPADLRIFETPEGWLCFGAFGSAAVIYWAAIEPSKRAERRAQPNFEAALEHLKNRGFRRVDLVCRRKNIKPQIVALKAGFQIFALCADKNEIQIVMQKEL